MTSNGERKVITVENNAGGKGPMTIEHLLGEKELVASVKCMLRLHSSRKFFRLPRTSR